MHPSVSRIGRLVDESLAHRPRRFLIAYSGGVDSTALLHMAMQWAGQRAASRHSEKIETIAVHVNHGLHADADEWERFCRRAATRFGVAFEALRVVADARGRSPEEAARDARYAALKTRMQSGDVLMTGHHRDDQSETVLLQLLRGAGPEGLAGMPACAEFGTGHIARPLLDLSRAQIEQYAHDHGLEWCDDPANDDLRYDRNYIRTRFAPVLSERWPAWRETLARAARHQADAREIIIRVAQRHYQDCRDTAGTLSVARCLKLRDAEQRAVLRYWIKRRGLPTPSERLLQRLRSALLSGDASSGALVCWSGAEVRYYRGCLYAMAPLAPPADTGARRWTCGADLELPEINARLTWRSLCERAPELSDAPALTVRLRRGGEKCAYAGGRHHKRLKKVFQELGVPPWERDRVPLVYFGDELRVVWAGARGNKGMQ